MASTIMTLFNFRRKVRCHKGAVEKLGSVEVIGIAPNFVKMF